MMKGRGVGSDDRNRLFVWLGSGRNNDRTDQLRGYGFSAALVDRDGAWAERICVGVRENNCECGDRAERDDGCIGSWFVHAPNVEVGYYAFHSARVTGMSLRLQATAPTSVVCELKSLFTIDSTRENCVIVPPLAKPRSHL